jgi:light-harvesting complex I chlorophyll a/b binding protein 1
MATMMNKSATRAMGARASRASTVKVSANKKTSSNRVVLESTRDYLLTMPGISAPFSDVFDPAGFTDRVTVKELRRYREAELTHGRVSMLAALGFIVGEQLEDFPAFLNFDGRITGPAITHFQKVGPGFWEPLVLAIGICESYRVALGWAPPQGAGFNSLRDEYEIGDLNFDPLNLKPEDPEELKVMQTRELNNGRLAMIAIAAFVAQEFVEKTEIFEHLALRLEREVVEELDDIEREVGLPLTAVPVIPK